MPSVRVVFDDLKFTITVSRIDTYECIGRAMLYTFFVIFLQLSTILAARQNSSVSDHAVTTNYATSTERSQFENSLVEDQDDEEADFKSIVCSVFPATCSSLSSFSRRFFSFGNYLGT